MAITIKTVKFEKVANTEPNNCRTWKSLDREWTVREEKTAAGKIGYSIYQFGTLLSSWPTAADAMNFVEVLAGN